MIKRHDMLHPYVHYTKQEHDAHLQCFNKLGITYNNTIYNGANGLYSCSYVEQCIHELMVILKELFIELNLPREEFHVFVNKDIDQLKMYVFLNNEILPKIFEVKITELYDNLKNLPNHIHPNKRRVDANTTIRSNKAS